MRSVVATETGARSQTTAVHQDVEVSVVTAEDFEVLVVDMAMTVEDTVVIEADGVEEEAEVVDSTVPMEVGVDTTVPQERVTPVGAIAAEATMEDLLRLAGGLVLPLLLAAVHPQTVLPTDPQRLLLPKADRDPLLLVEDVLHLERHP